MLTKISIMELKNLLFTYENYIAVIKFNRPNVLNAINIQTMHELGEVIDACAANPEIRVIIITGEGKAFAAGADISELQKFGPEKARELSKYGIEVYRKIELLNKVVIAAVNGFALGGGCELAMACDIRIASEKAKFGQPETKLGIIPGYGGTQRLTRLIGRGRSKLLTFTGDMIDAKTAERYGLVDEVVAPEKLLEKAKELAKKIADLSPISIRCAKNAINTGIESGIEAGLALENELFAYCFGTDDAKEGIQAFLEKRKPTFTGK